MKHHLMTVLALWGAASAVAALPADVAFDRYQVILDRKPFGELPPADSLVNAVPQAESFAKSLRLSTIIDVDDGATMKVGFVDTRTGKSYMLMPGDPAIDGIEVVSASWADEEAILKQGAEMALIKIASGEVQAITAAEQQRREQQAVQQGRPSYEERRRMRQREQEQEEPPPQPRYTGEALKKHLQEYQMEVIRQGLPPLPIPLTPEMDQQLIREGVLPP